MSHFTYIKTRFQSLFYLEKTLNKLNITYKEKPIDNSNLYNKNLVISQSDWYDMEFLWNSQEYELVTDMSFWRESSSLESLIDTISQQYAGEVIIGESQKIGFEPVKYQQNSDNSKTLVLERWNSASSFK